MTETSRKPHFDGTITLGNIFQALTLAGAVFAGVLWIHQSLYDIDRRVLSIEQIVSQRAGLEQRISALEGFEIKAGGMIDMHTRELADASEDREKLHEDLHDLEQRVAANHVGGR